MKKIKILLLSANPLDTTRLRVDEEMREIKEGLRRSKHRDKFEIITAPAVRSRDIQRAILDNDPNIIHFSGHGGSEQGLVFEDIAGGSKLVDAEALAGLFGLFSDKIECVLLNACYSEVQAEVIAKKISYVVGMKEFFDDQAAIEFAVGFYDGLGAGKTINFAYKLGCNAIDLASLRGQVKPYLFNLLNNISPKPDIPVYIERPPIEKQCYEELRQPGSLIHIKAPSKMGKTELINNIIDYANNKDFKIVEISFSGQFDRGDISSLESLLINFCYILNKELGINHNIEKYWQNNGGSNKLKCTYYFDNYVLLDHLTTLVLCISDIDVLFPYKTVSQDFCSMLRFWYNRRTTIDAWKKLKLVTSYSTSEIKLPDPQSPFNVGTKIELPDFNLEQVQKLAGYYQLNLALNQIKAIIKIIGGHPELVTKAFKHLQNYPEKKLETNFKEFLELMPTDEGIFNSHLRKISRKLNESSELKMAFREMLYSEDGIILKEPIKLQLELLGLIQFKGHKAFVRRLIYQDYFKEHLTY